jgi:hypothetical protein
LGSALAAVSQMIFYHDPTESQCCITKRGAIRNMSANGVYLKRRALIFAIFCFLFAVCYLHFYSFGNGSIDAGDL